MYNLIKSIIYPLYFLLLRLGRRMRLVYKPSIRFCISTNKNFAGQTIPILIESLLTAGIPPDHIYIFEGGYQERSFKQSKCHHFLTDHNSFDLTALIEVSGMDVHIDYWLLLHDTCAVDINFRELISNIPHYLPLAMTICNYPSMNMGAYKTDLIKRSRNLLLSMKNTDYSEGGLQKAKISAVENEDIIFRSVTDRKQVKVYNPWKGVTKKPLPSQHPLYHIYPGRTIEYFPQAGIIKFKANPKTADQYNITL